MSDGKTVNFGADANVNVADSSLKVMTRGEGTVTLANAGTINVSGTSDIAATVTGEGWVYMNGVTLSEETNLIGAKVRFASGNNTVDGSTIDDGFFQVGIGAYNGVDANVDTTNGVTVNVKNNAKIGSSGSTYAGWVGTGFYDTDAEKAAAMTEAKYILNIDKSIAEFGYLHVSQDGVLNVTGNAAEQAHYNNSVYSFRGGDFIINGTATFDATNVLAFYTKVSCDNGTDKPGTLNIENGTYYEAERHNGAVDGTNFILYKTGVVNVDNAELYVGEYSRIEADAKLNVKAATVTVLGTVTNNGTIAMDTDSTVTVSKLTPDGTITVNTESLPVGGEAKKVIEQTSASAASLEGKVTFTESDISASYTDGDVTLTKEAPVAKIGENEYTTLAEAIEDATPADTITVINNFVEVVNVPADKTVTVDLNGKTMNGSILAPSAALTIQNGSIVNTNKAVSALEINAGTLNLTNVNIDSARHALRIDGAVTANINGGTYRSAIGMGTGTYHAANISGTATVTIENGTFVGPKGTSADSGAAVNVQTGATVTINGGNFSGGKNSTLAAAGTLTVKGGTYDQNPAVYVSADYAVSAGNNVYTVVDAVASINNETGYASFQEAVESAAAGDTIKLLSDVTVSGSVDLTGKTINQNGKTITMTAGATLKVAAAVTITAPSGYYVVESVSNGVYTYSLAAISYSGSSSSSSGDYAITTEKAENGSIKVSPSRADAGDTVTITVTPDKGYKLDTLTVTDKNGDEIKVTEKNGKYTFEMPKGKVSVEATFAEVSELPFTDVADGFWAEDAIAWAYEEGLMNGNTATTFNPNGLVTRQQVWMILARMNDYAPEDMAAAKGWAVANGISDGSNPGNAVTRQQLVTLIWRAEGEPEGDVSALANYPDAASVADYAKEAMAWAIENGVIGGTTQGTLNPAGNANRAQLAVILYRYVG